MLDIGWSELLVIGVVALIVVGPKDLPGMFRTMGQFTGKMRRMARDFQRAMDDAADTSGIRQTAADLKTMTSPKSLGLNTLQQAADRFDKWDPAKSLKPAAPAAPAAAPAPAPGPATAALKENQALEAQKRIAAARAAREAKAAAEAAARAKADEPVRFVPREKPGVPTAAAARPKNMPTKKPGRGRG
jgi:sec-independent protein translocase protein TatB